MSISGKHRQSKPVHRKKACHPHGPQAFFLLRFTLINYSKQFKLPAAALHLRPLIISLAAKSIAYSKLFSLNGHSSTTTQPRHNGLRALQILRPCQINQWCASLHISRAIIFSSSFSVASGSLPFANPKRCDTRKTCVSTASAGML